jgi:hypothetical protein
MEYNELLKNNSGKVGTMTDIAFDNLCNHKISFVMDFTFDQKDLDYAEELGNRNTFLEGIVETLNKKGFKCESKDIEKITKEIEKRYKDKLGISCPRTVKEWIKGTDTSVNVRTNNFEVCLALDMNLEETCDFFVKSYLEIPFNFKDRVDMIFYYSLKNNLSDYSEIKEMLNKSANFDTTNEYVGLHTTEILRQINEITDNDEFMEYLKNHCYSKEQQYQRARNEIIKLIDKYKKEGNGKGFTKLEDEVTGHVYQRDHIEKNGDKKLPIRFTRSLPQHTVFSDIYKGKKETHETIRKAFIILKFYDFYSSKKDSDEVSDKNVQDDFWDFCDDLDEELINTGLAPLYKRNPFDWLILLCAASNQYPIDAFYKLMDITYDINDEE